MDDLDPEDGKLLVLARAARARAGAPEGAAVRDETGRTYAAATVNLPSLRLSALGLAVAMAASSGAERLEAAVLVSDAPGFSDSDLAVIGDVGPRAALILAGSDGAVRERRSGN